MLVSVGGQRAHTTVDAMDQERTRAERPTSPVTLDAGNKPVWQVISTWVQAAGCHQAKTNLADSLDMHGAAVGLQSLQKKHVELRTNYTSKCTTNTCLLKTAPGWLLCLNLPYWALTACEIACIVPSACMLHVSLQGLGVFMASPQFGSY
eukprot:GHRR01019283.1.p1 GENE.GHRR01019283.1~~GHRR01019283.1.p1  ORF type:complete len:150 (+),score=28.54 GHRR01019283.1:349-798(+)